MDALTVAVRFVNMAASTLPLGIFAFLCLIGHPALRRAGPVAREEFLHFQQSLWRIVAWSLAVIFLSGLLGFALQAASMAGLPLARALTLDTLSAALTTQYGWGWLLRQVLLILLAVLLAPLMRPVWRAAGVYYAGFTLAAALLASLVIASHAAAGEGTMLVVQLVADMSHLLAAGIWLGALIPLALLLSWCRRNDLAWSGAVAQEATRRFSLMGIATVSTLLVTGLFNAWQLVGGIPQLVGTSYGRLLLIKLGMLLPLLALAAINLLYIKPRMLVIAPYRSGTEFRDLLTRLRRNAVGEAGIGTAVLLVVAMLGVTAPALHVQPEWPFTYRWNWEVNKALPEKRFPILVGKTFPEKRLSILIGAGLAACALLPFGYAVMRRRHRRWALGLGLAAVGGGAALALPALELDAYPATYRRSAVPYQAISVANGWHLYQEHCVICHGIAGFGDGPAAATLNGKPADLTGKHTGDHTAGDLFWWVSHGIVNTPMPGFDQVLNEEERWDLINYLRTLSAAEQGRSMAPLLEPAWLVAPEFAYRTLAGENKSLKEHRGQNVVLLVLFTWPQSQPRLQQLDAMHDALSAAGVEVLAVPRDAGAILDRHQTQPLSLSVAIDGSQEAFETFGMLRRSLSEEGMRPDAPLPSHMEFLIDRQGYIRARWIADESRGWANAELLMREVTQLNQEKPSAPAPDDHVH
jgi:putative copper resistance protein D